MKKATNGDVIRSLSYFKLLIMKFSNAADDLLICHLFVFITTIFAIFLNVSRFLNDKIRFVRQEINENCVHFQRTIIQRECDARICCNRPFILSAVIGVFIA